MKTSERFKEIWEELEENILHSSLDEAEKKVLFTQLIRLKSHKVNILITGATGSGKSSTINAVFDMSIATVGHRADPETTEIQKYELKNLVLWDSPGLGDSEIADLQHSQNIINKVNEIDDNGYALIDVVLVIIDGSSRDMGTTYKLINEVIIPYMPKDKSRIIIAVNQCDNAMKGKGWNTLEKKPDEELAQFLEEKLHSVQRRIFEGTGVSIEPIYYSASEHYNISKLLRLLIKHIPVEKRISIIDTLNTNHNGETNDGNERYDEKIHEYFFESVMYGIREGARKGEEIGDIFFGVIGAQIGKVLGGAAGAFIEGAKAIKRRLFG
jgi:predicted GTPase